MVHLDRRQLLRGSLAFAGLSLCSGCGVLPVPGQQTTKVSRIGYLTQATTDAAELEAFRDGLRELGYIDGQNIAIDVRMSQSPQQVPAQAAELVALPVDLIVTAGGFGDTQAAMGATRTIPIVFPASPDPVGIGLVASLARPGGNVTGFSALGPQPSGKRLELLLELAPGVSRVIFLTVTAGSQSTGILPQAQQAAKTLGVQFLAPTIGTPADLAVALQTVIVNHSDALWVSGSPLINGEVGRIMAFATAERLPVLSQTRIFVDAGGLLYYGPNRLALFRGAATYVDKILRGAKPEDLPVEQPSTFDLVVNKRTADTLGLPIPRSVLQQVTELIQ